MIYLIEKIWIDKMENEVSAAVGYAPYSYTESEIEAERIVTSGKKYTMGDCWAITNPMGEFRTKIVPRYDEVKDSESNQSS